MSVLTGPRPDVTPAQLISAVPVVVGVAATAARRGATPEQSRVLRGAMVWASALVVADALLRVGRGVAARPPAVAPPPADLLAHPDALLSGLAGPLVEPGEEEVVFDSATDPYHEEDFEPLPAGNGHDADLLAPDLDVELTKTGAADEAAAKPADFR